MIKCLPAVVSIVAVWMVVRRCFRLGLPGGLRLNDLRAQRESRPGATHQLAALPMSQTYN